LQGPTTLSRGERELIAAYVSSRNDCFFCHEIHGAVAAYHFGGDEKLVRDVKQDAQTSAVSAKLKS
jgi:AhpD family alkylhydroperoxidase